MREEDSSWQSEGYSGPSATSRRLWTRAGACEHQACHQLLADATQAELRGFHRLLGFPNRVLRISHELSCDVSRAPSYKGFAETGQQLMLVQIVNLGIQSVVYSYCKGV